MDLANAVRFIYYCYIIINHNILAQVRGRFSLMSKSLLTAGIVEISCLGNYYKGCERDIQTVHTEHSSLTELSSSFRMPDNVFLNMNNYFLYIYIIMLKYILPENNKR